MKYDLNLTDTHTKQWISIADPYYYYYYYCHYYTKERV